MKAGASEFYEKLGQESLRRYGLPVRELMGGLGDDEARTAVAELQDSGWSVEEILDHYEGKYDLIRLRREDWTRGG